MSIDILPIIATKQFEFSKKKTFILPGGVEKEVLEGQFPKTGVRFELDPGGPVGFCGNAKDERQLVKKEQNEEKSWKLSGHNTHGKGKSSFNLEQGVDHRWKLLKHFALYVAS